jgi:hypothetical protein
VALVFHSGFETNDFSEWNSTTGSPSIDATTKKTGSYAMRCNTSSAQAYAGGPGSITRFSLYLYIASFPSSTTLIVGSESVANVRLGTTGILYLYDGNTEEDSYSSLNTGQWYRISGSIDGSNNAKLFVDGIERCTTSAMSETYFGASLGVISSVTADLYFDDWAQDSTASTADLGDIRVQVALPESNGNANQYDQTTGYTYCDNLPADTDYVEDNGSDVAREQFNIPSMTSMGIAGETPQAVNVIVRMDRDGGGATTHSISVRDNSTDFEYATAGVAAWTQYNQYLATMPSGGGAWTEVRWDALQVGVYHLGNQDQRCSTALAMLAYTVVPSALDVNVADANPAVTDAVTIRLLQLKPNVSDSVGVTDIVTMQRIDSILSINVADANPNITDAVTMRLLQLKPNVSDNMGVTDTATVRLTTLKINVVDTIGLTDTVNVKQQIRIDGFDNLTVTDAIIMQLDLLRVSLADAVGVSDAVAMALSPLKLSAADAITLTDAITARLPLLKISEADSLTIAEAVTVSIDLLKINVADNLTVTASVTVDVTTGVLSINVADTITLTDSTALQLDLLKINVAETLTVAESLSTRLDLLKINVADSITVVDSATVIIGAGVLSINVADSIAVAELVAMQLDLLKFSVADAVGLTDAITARLDLLKASLADTLTLTDAVTPRLDLLKIDTSDSLTVAELAQISVTPLKVSVGEAVGVSEGLTVSTTPLKFSVADSLGISDSVAATIIAQALAVDVADAIGLTDSAAAAIAIYPLLRAFLFVKQTSSNVGIRRCQGV